MTFKGTCIGDIVRFIIAEGDCSALSLCCGVMMIVVEWGELRLVRTWCPWIIGEGVNRSEGQGAGSAQRVPVDVGVVGGVADGVGDGRLWDGVGDGQQVWCRGPA